MSNPFAERFKTITVVQLVDIIVNPKNYNGDALVAAKMEIERRQLSPEEIGEAKKILESRSNADHEKESKWKINLSGLFDFSRKKTPDESVKLLCISLLLLLGYKIFEYIPHFSFVNYQSSLVTAAIYVILFNLILMATTIILLWKKNKIGYWILYIWLLLSIVMFLLSILGNYVMNASRSTYTSATSFFIYLVIYSSLFWFINTKNLKRAFFGRKEEEIEELINNFDNN